MAIARQAITDPRPAHLNHVRAAAKRLAEIARDCPDVRPGTDRHRQADEGQFEIRCSQLMDRDRAGIDLNALAGPSGTIRGNAVAFHRAELGWHLFDLAAESS